MKLNVKASVELKAGEVLIQTVNPSKWLYAASLPVGCVLGLVGLVIAISGAVWGADKGDLTFAGFGVVILLLSWLPFLKDYIYRNTTELTITDKRVIVKSGWLSVQMDEINREKVEAVSLHQGIIARMFGIGDLLVSGSGGRKISARAIAEPRAVRNQISE